MRTILLIMIGLSVSIWADFNRDDARQIVTDNSTGLQWQDDSSTIDKNWADAIDYCETLTLGNYTDWRLPNLNELHSIVDRSKHHPAMDSVFKNVAPYGYWSSTTRVREEYSAWEILFYDGRDDVRFKYQRSSVRCVRDGQ